MAQGSFKQPDQSAQPDLPVVYLVGARASGKTTTGRVLAKMAECPFVDTDALIREMSGGQEVAEIVAAEGWSGFRSRESLALMEARRQVIARHGSPGQKLAGVIATGGGMVLAEKNRDFMRYSGHVVWLAPPVESLVSRLLADPLEAQRPSLTGAGLAEETRHVLAEREPLYREAAHQIIAGNEACEASGQICKKILEAVLGSSIRSN